MNYKQWGKQFGRGFEGKGHEELDVGSQASRGLWIRRTTCGVESCGVNRG